MMLVLVVVLAACGGEKAPASQAPASQAPADNAAKVLEGSSTKGMGGEKAPLKVKVTLEGDKITKVEVVEHGETPDISKPAIEQIPAKIVEKNGTEGVDAVAGATLTTDAIKDAVDNALKTK